MLKKTTHMWSSSSGRVIISVSMQRDEEPIVILIGRVITVDELREAAEICKTALGYVCTDDTRTQPRKEG